jgi:uncharacterized Fe-S cluster-containing radical SAM superfamily enzyme
MSIDKPLEGYLCTIPFTRLEIHEGYYGYACCPSWLPEIIGNCEKEGIAEVWNSEKMQKIRASILDGSYSYCNKEICPNIQNNKLFHHTELDGMKKWIKVYENKLTVMEEPPEAIELNYDFSCNLSCPSCRNEQIIDNAGESFEEKEKFTENVLEFIDKNYINDDVLELLVTGSGDPFASPVYFKLLQKLRGKDLPYFDIVLHTNGVLLTPHSWSKLTHIHKNINNISVSIDAATKETYLKVRRLSNWEMLLKNLEFMATLLDRGEIKLLNFNFVVQNDNYIEMIDFVKLARRYHSKIIVFFTLMQNWGTFSESEYQKQMIWDEGHVNYLHFLRTLKDPVFDDEYVHLGSLKNFREMALKKTDI